MPSDLCVTAVSCPRPDVVGQAVSPAGRATRVISHHCETLCTVEPNTLAVSEMILEGTGF